MVLLDPKSQSLSNIAHIQGKELPDCCKKHFNLGALQDFFWPSEMFVLSWFVMSAVFDCVHRSVESTEALE